MNGHPQFAETLALYALGALDDPRELAELQTHLGSCGECRRELESLRADAALLALSTVGPKPPERSRQRLLQAIAAEPRVERRVQKPYVVGRLRSRWLSFAPMMVMLLLAVFSILLWRDLRETRRELRQARFREEQRQQQLNDERKRSAEAQEVLSMWNAPNAMRMTLVSTPKARPQPLIQTIYMPEKGHILMVANNLAPLPPDKVYELWLLPAQGAPMPAGTFRPDASGNGIMLHPMESGGIAAKGFAVTIEQAGGSQVPTMPIVMAPAG
jgi:Anti-sigma-K factor rskA, C-terminal